MKSKYPLILCDACVIIKLFEINSFEKVIENFNILISATIINEVKFYYNENKDKIPINLKEYLSNKEIQEISVLASEAEQFLSNYDPTYKEKIDPGELELLCYLFKHKNKDMFICSGDAIVFKILGKKLIGDKSISLEEILYQIGFGTKKIPKCFTKKWKEQKLQEGLQDSSL